MNYKLLQKYQLHNLNSSNHIWYKVGLPASEGTLLLYEIEKGFDVEIIQLLSNELNWPINKLVQLIGFNRSTFNRRMKRHRLTSQESEVVARVIRVYESILAMFNGDKVKALQWIEETAVALGNEKPVLLMKSESGANDIIKLTHRLMHGVYV